MPSKQGEKSAINLFWPSHTHTQVHPREQMHRKHAQPLCCPPPPSQLLIISLTSGPCQPWKATRTKADKMLRLVAVAAPVRLCARTP